MDGEKKIKQKEMEVTKKTWERKDKNGIYTMINSYQNFTPQRKGKHGGKNYKKEK